MADAPQGFFVAKVGMLGSRLDPEPFDLNADLGPLPAAVVVSDWRHAAAETEVPPCGDAVIERIGNDLMASGTLWVETTRGRDVAVMLQHLGKRARFSVSYRILSARPPSRDERVGGIVRVLTKVRLLELSAVLVPAEPSTRRSR